MLCLSTQPKSALTKTKPARSRVSSRRAGVPAAEAANLERALERTIAQFHSDIVKRRDAPTVSSDP